MRPGPDLVTAAVATSFETLADDAEECLQRESQGSPAMAELTGFLSRVMDTVAHNRAVKQPCTRSAPTTQSTPPCRRWRLASPRPSAGSSATAQAQGGLRADFTFDDLYLMLSTLPADQPPTARARWLALLLTGLTALYDRLACRQKEYRARRRAAERATTFTSRSSARESSTMRGCGTSGMWR
jgi:hypothetical protein